MLLVIPLIGVSKYKIQHQPPFARRKLVCSSCKIADKFMYAIEAPLVRGSEQSIRVFVAIMEIDSSQQRREDG